VRLSCIAALSLSVLAACTQQYDPCFDQPGIIKDLRILGVRADPPQAMADLIAGTVQPVSARVLVADPITSDELTVGAQACAPDWDGGCAMTEVVREPQLFPDGTQILVAPSAGLIAEALRRDPLQGYGGIQAQLQIVVRGVQGERRATKTLLYTTPEATDPPNHGLEIVGLRARRLSHYYHQVLSDPPPPDDELIPVGGILYLDRFDATWLRPVLGPGPGGTEAAEEYVTTDLSGKRVTLRERVTYSFFSSFGDISGPQAGQVAPRVFFSPTADGTEPPPGEDPSGLTSIVARQPGQGVLWIVARDGRGAEAWLTMTWVARDYTLQGNPIPNLGPDLGRFCND
jgi:hypothetical protein